VAASPSTSIRHNKKLSNLATSRALGSYPPTRSRSLSATTATTRTTYDHEQGKNADTYSSRRSSLVRNIFLYPGRIHHPHHHLVAASVLGYRSQRTQEGELQRLVSGQQVLLALLCFRSILISRSRFTAAPWHTRLGDHVGNGAAREPG